MHDPAGDREEVLTRLEMHTEKQWEEEKARWEENSSKRNELLNQLEGQLQRMWEDALKYRNEANNNGKELADKMTQLDILEQSMKIREEALRIREQEAQLKKSDNTWNMGQIVSMLAFISGLMLLIQIWTLLPPEHLNFVVGAFAILWALGSIAFVWGVFPASRTMRNFSGHVAQFIDMCFSLFVLYALYITSRHVDGTSPGASLLPASVSTAATFGRSTLFETIAMVQDTPFPILACASGSRDTNVSTHALQ